MAESNDKTHDVTLYEEGGVNPVNVINDGGVRRLAVDAKESSANLISESKIVYASRHATGLSNGTDYDHLIVTSTGKVHLTLDFRTLGGGYLYIYEGVTASSNGTSMTVFNRNRASSSVLTATVFHTPTITGTGTLIQASICAGTNAGIQDSMKLELILKVSTKYLFRFRSTAGSNALVFNPVWYEV